DRVLDVELRWINTLARLHVLELQTGLAGRVSDGTDPAVIQEAAAVEHHSPDALLEQPLGDGFANRLSTFRVSTLHVFGKRRLECRLRTGSRNDRRTVEIVDHLRVDVGHAPKHTESRPLLTPGDSLSLAQMNALAAIGFGVDFHFAPVFPAFFFSTSPV